jgi:hypothetical protein
MLALAHQLLRFLRSSQIDGSSALAFSHSRRFRAGSQSKMPPQQAYGLLDFVDNDLGFCTH